MIREDYHQFVEVGLKSRTSKRYNMEQVIILDLLLSLSPSESRIASTFSGI